MEHGMQTRDLGRTGIRVSPIGLGLVKLGRNRGVKYPAGYDLPTDAEATALLDAAATLGVNLLDTAPAYGTSEERLGTLLAARGDRDSWVISTKSGEEFDGEVSSFDFSPGAIVASCERSLRRLGTDRVDLFLIHSDGVAEARLDELGAFDALERLKRRGLVRAVGVSVKTAEGAMKAIGRTDAVMVEYSVSSPEMGWVIDHAAGLGAGIVVKKALSSGHLGAGGVAGALAYVFTRPVSSVVIGTSNPGHLAEAVSARCHPPG